MLVVDRHPGDVGRQQVRGELDARLAALDRVRQGARQHRLAGAGVVLEQDVALGQQARQREPDDVTWSGAYASLQAIHYELDFC